MKNIPVFTTEHGVASLILREIPYRKIAYIRLQATQEPKELLKECIGFCRACGAERILATGHDFLEAFSLHTVIVWMQADRESLLGSDACLFPVTEATVNTWKAHYNARMADVPNAAYMDDREAKEMLQKGDAYFIHKDGALLGIGRASENILDAIISLVPGGGEAVVRTLTELLTEDTVMLQVAHNNSRAVRLYERLGFVKVGEVSRWYRVL